MAHHINIKNSSISVNKNIFCEEIDEGYFLLDSDSGEYFEFFEASAIIWKIIYSQKEKISYLDLIDSISKHFNPNSETEKDLENFLLELVELKIISIAE